MPARTTSAPNGAVATATTKPATKRFELPVLDFKFGSLTEGTNIPAPLPSPIEEEPPEFDTKEAKSKEKDEQEDKENKKANGVSSKMNGTLANSAYFSTSRTARPLTTGGGLKRTAADLSPSPTMPTRAGSVRRLFSRRRLNVAYANAETEGQQGVANINGHGLDTASIARPESRSGFSFMDDRKSRRTSGWFRRLRGGASGSNGSSNGSIYGDAQRSPLWKRSSMIYEEPQKPMGPPPPMIPELAELNSKVDLDDGGSLGNDLFKNIK